MKNKYLITIIVPKIELKFNLYVPINKKVGTIKTYLLKSINDLSDNTLDINITDMIFIDKEMGNSYENNMYIRDSGIKNGSEIIIL